MSKFHLPSDKPFVIAEIANAHTGSVEKLKKLVSKAIETKADAIKFQLFNAKELLIPTHPDFNLYKELEINNSVWTKLFQTLKKKRITIFADVFDVKIAKFADKNGIDAFKIHSSDINNIELIECVANTGKPILLSCSGCTTNEIDTAVNSIRRIRNSQIILMHGFQGFPTRLSDINLSRVLTLKRRYNLPVGFMDHIDGSSDLAIYLPVIAIGLGANIIEKHITLNRALKEEDYQSALHPTEFAKMVKLLKKSYKSWGTGSLELSSSERLYRKNMKKRPVSRKNLREKTKIKRSDIALKRIHYNIPEIQYNQLINSFTKTRVKKDTPLYYKNVKTKTTKVVAVIACRVTSKRLFAKPLQLINDKTILDYIISQLRRSKLIDEIVLAISENIGNEIFVEFARKKGLKFVRGDDIDVLKRVILAAEHVNGNVVLRVTSEDPLKYWEAIDPAIKQHIESKADFTFTDGLPEGAGFEIINLESLKLSHEKGTARNRSELVTSYIYERKTEFKIQPFKIKSDLRRPEIRLTVDYPEDLILIRSIISKLPKDMVIPRLEQVIRILDENPQLKEINKKFVAHKDRIWL